jgi:L-seryl-tRNA(Ser) seleniumtransferase
MTIETRPATAADPLLERLGLRPVINVGGSISRIGGTALVPEVREAMTAAASSFIPMVELQAWASETIASATGAEAGCVASGAAACLFLASAASLARFDPGVMDRLPDTTGIPNEIVVHRAHRNPYDHALRAAGAKFVEFGYMGPANPGTRRWQMESVISERTAAVFYPGAVTAGVLPLREVAEIAHRHDLPVIVDAAEMVPPPENLRRFIDEGADLVAFSGGKAVGGPAASGFLAGRRDLIWSATAQQQDMFVRPASWPGPHGGSSRDALPDPPQQAIGRIVKVGREEIVGLVVALRRYVGLDHAAQRARWAAMAARIAADVDGAGGAGAAVVGGDEAPVPIVAVTPDVRGAGRGPAAASRVIAALRDRDPRVWAGEEFLDHGQVAINVQHLRDDEVETVIERLREVLGRR